MNKKTKRLTTWGVYASTGMMLLSGCTIAGGGGGGPLATLPEVNGSARNGKCSDSSSVGSSDFQLQDITGTHLEVAYKFLVGKGMSKQGAAAIVASIYVESAGGYPWKAEIGKPWTDNYGWGIVQWTGVLHTQVREAIIKDPQMGEKYYTSQYDDPPAEEWMTDEDVAKLMQWQLNYLWNQLQQPEFKANVFDPIYNAKDAGTAGSLFVTGFERPLDTAGEAARRALLAEEYYQNFKDLPVDGGSSSSEQDKSDSKPSSDSSNESGSGEASKMKWAFPFDGRVNITSRFGIRPAILGVPGSWWHAGIDLVPAGGSLDVRSISSGVVTHAEFDSMSGNMVVVKLDNGDMTRMAHLASMDVKAGDRVEAGQKVGVMGGTGSASTAPHLHFETLTGEDIDDPNKWGNTNHLNVKTSPADYMDSKGFNMDGSENGKAPTDTIVRGTSGGSGKDLSKSCKSDSSSSSGNRTATGDVAGAVKIAEEISYDESDSRHNASVLGGTKSEAKKEYQEWKAKAEEATGADGSYWASCDRAVATIIKNTLDPDLPWGATTAQHTYLSNSDKWEAYTDPKERKPGDIFVTQGDGHIVFYAGDTSFGDDMVVEASYGQPPYAWYPVRHKYAYGEDAFITYSNGIQFIGFHYVG